MGVAYRVANWVDVANEYREQAAIVHLDANWAAPARYSGRGVDYVTHPITKEATNDFPDSELKRDEIDTSRTIADMIDAAWNALKPGGWLLMDADSYASRRFQRYLAEEYGEVRVASGDTRPYRGGGLRKVADVRYVKKDGTPDCSGTGQYGTEAGYPVVMAHKAETDREWSESVRLDARRPRWREPTDEYGQGTVKPVGPYKVWLDALADESELVLAPCAGSAPALIAAEALWGDNARAVAIDTQQSARSAWERRREELLSDRARGQRYLGTFAENAP